MLQERKQKKNIMEKSIQVYNSKQFGTVRTVTIDGEPWLVGKDVAEILGFKNPRQALASNVDDEDRGVHAVDTPSGVQNMAVINESGLLSLVLCSKLPSAKAFKHWVTKEVLPSIRKTGGYQQKPMTQLEIIAAQAQALVDHERRMNAIEETTKALDEKIDAAADAFMAPSFSVETWRTETKSAISAIVEAEKLSYGIYTGELYKKLENVAGCNLADRQTRMKNRMRKEGATASQCNMVTKLYIISLDQKLRAIFDHIMVQEKASRLMKGGRTA